MLDAYRTLEREAQSHHVSITEALREVKVTSAPKPERCLLGGATNALSHFNVTKKFEREVKKNVERFCRLIGKQYEVPRSAFKQNSTNNIRSGSANSSGGGRKPSHAPNASVGRAPTTSGANAEKPGNSSGDTVAAAAQTSFRAALSGWTAKLDPLVLFRI